jgi:hypothetical protein
MSTPEITIDLIDRAEINASGVLVQYSKTEAALAALREKYTGATFDLTTTKGDKEARAARLELTTLRTSLEKRRKEFKAPALEFGKKIDAEAARITGEIEALEQPIDAQIRADENRRAAEKAERERIERDRIAAHQNRLNVIRACVGRAQGLPSARIANGIEQVEAMPTDAATWEEFAGEAEATKAETLAAMRTMFEAAKAREDEEARVEQQRLENERQAAENRAAAERLAEQQRELEAKAASIKAEQDAIDAHRAEQLAEAERKTQAAITAAAAPAAAPLAAPPPVAAPVSPAVHTDSGPRLSLGQINERIAPLAITVAGLSSLGYEPVEQVKSMRLYRESDFHAICNAIVRHVKAVAAGVTA